MDTYNLLDKYPHPWACGPWASGVHIRQTTLSHVITYTYHDQYMHMPFSHCIGKN